MAAAAAGVVGREGEYGALDRFLGSPERLPRVFVLEGAAGIGKTTLWAAGVDEARRSYTVLSARPAEAETKLAFSGLGDLLEGALDTVLPDLRPPQARALQVALLLEEAPVVAPDERAVAAATLSTIRALASRSPLVVAVDDVQWLDPASTAVLAYAIRRVRDVPVAFLLAQRSEDASLPLGLERADPQLEVERVRLEPLPLDALREILRERLAVAFPRPTLRKLYETSGGNPFLAIEVGAALLRSGGTDGSEPLTVPGSLNELVRDRLGALPPPARRLLPYVAALAEPTRARLQAALGDSSDPVAGLEAAIGAGVLGRDGARIRFSHPLLASVAYTELPTEERRRLHQRLGETAGDPEERGRHLALASSGPDAEVAASLEAAAVGAFRRGASDTAAGLYAQARRLTPSDDEQAARRRTVGEAECLHHGGDSGRARDILEEALAASAPGRPRAEIQAQLGRVCGYGMNWRLALDHSLEALREAGDDTSLRARIELDLARVIELLGEDFPAIIEHAVPAGELARRLGDDAMLAEALAIEARSRALWGQGDPVPIIERALALQSPEVPAVQQPSDYLATLHEWADDFDQALGALRSSYEWAVDHGEETARTWTLARTSRILCLTGAWTEAFDGARRGFEFALHAGQPANQAVALATSALVEAHLGRSDPVRESAARALDLAEASGATLARRVALTAIGLLELSGGRPHDAHDQLGPLVANARDASIEEPGALRFVPDDIEALIAMGEVDAAESSLDWYESRARSRRRASALARAARCRGLMAASEGDQEGAIELFEQALDQHAHVPMPFDRARTLLELGAAQRRARQRRAARGSLEEGAAVFAELGAVLWARRAYDELRRIGGRGPGGDGLTPTEQRVAGLVAQGLTNREVASAAFLSPKTVEFHLRNIFRKLGVRSRTEMAGKMSKEATPSNR